MPLNYNGTAITTVNYNGVVLQTVNYNGVTVWTASVDAPSIGTITTTYNSATFTVTNTSVYSGTLRVTVNDYEQTYAVDGINIPNPTLSHSFIFNYSNAGLTSGVTYSISAYLYVDSTHQSGATMQSFTTDTLKLTAPSAVGILPSSASIDLYLKNNDLNYSAIIVGWVEKNGAPVGNSVSQTLNPNTAGVLKTISELSDSTSYTLRVQAMGLDGIQNSDITEYTVTTAALIDIPIALTASDPSTTSVTLYVGVGSLTVNGSWSCQSKTGTITNKTGTFTISISGLTPYTTRDQYSAGTTASVTLTTTSSGYSQTTKSVTFQLLIPPVQGFSASCPSSSTVRLSYTTNDWYVECRYKTISNDGLYSSWTLFNAKLPSAATNYTAPLGVGKVYYFAVRNRNLAPYPNTSTGTPQGDYSDWVVASTYIV